MKSYLIVCFFFCVAVVVSSKKCTEQSECKERQCCSGIPPFGGKCKNLTAAGKECHIEPKTVPMFGDFVIGPCPCVEGLKCVQKGEDENKGICQKPTALKSKKSGSTESTEDTSVEESTEDKSVEESAEDKSDEKSSNDFAPDYTKFIEKFKFKGH